MGLAMLPSLRDDREGLSTQFTVVIPGLQDVVFRECNGMESEVDTLSFSSGGNLRAPRTARGQHHVHRISFSHGSASSGAGGKSLFDWYLDVCDSNKPLTKKTLSIVVTSEAGDLAEWRILGAWPCRWVAPIIGSGPNQLTIEHVSFAHEGIERKK